jgi:predicted RNA methylase
MSKPQVVKVVHKDPFTYATAEQEIVIRGHKKVIVGHGFAKRDSTDQPDQRFGEMLASKEALIDLKNQRDFLKQKERDLKRISQVNRLAELEKENAKLRKANAFLSKKKSEEIA